MATGSGGDGLSNTADIPRGLINRTGNPIGRGSRLPSVRGHRDLTLGGIQRKVFTPNLAAVKKASIKDEVSKSSLSGNVPSNSEKQEGAKDKTRGKSERGRGRGRGRGQAEDRTVQLHSEFSYGPMGHSSSGWSRSRESGSGGGGGSRSNEADSATVRAAIKRSKGTEDDKKLLETLMRDNFISDLQSGDPNMAPVRLPLKINKGVFKYDTKAEIKEEFMDVDGVDCRTQNVSSTSTSSYQQSPPTFSDVGDILNLSVKSEKGQLLFLQFPDTLPGLPATVVTEEQPRPSNSQAVDTKEEELLKRLSVCQLKDCNEGYMGKLIIRKSGKSELVLGDNIMEVLPGIPINFHQELVSIHTDENTGQMIVLGPVSHKLVVTPDYNNLLSQVNKYS